MRWRSGARRRKRPARPPRPPRPPVRDRARRGLAILPSLLTLGNLVCGFFAIIHVGAVQWDEGVPVPGDAFQIAAIAILIAMIFDMLDGRVARMTNSTSDFGAQIDSLADVVTFGVAPGVMVAMLHAMGRYEGGAELWSRVAWVFGAAYACGAAIRLARFNVETESHDEEAHLYFKGLPSPAAAGVIASLVLLDYFLLTSQRGTTRLAWIEPTHIERVGLWILNALPFLALGAGYLMVSQFRYVHVANKYLKGRKPAEYLTAAIFLGAVAALFPEVVIALIFCGFALSGPLVSLRAWWTGGGEGGDDEEGEADDEPGTDLDANGANGGDEADDVDDLPPPAALSHLDPGEDGDAADHAGAERTNDEEPGSVRPSSRRAPSQNGEGGAP